MCVLLSSIVYSQTPRKKTQPNNNPNLVWISLQQLKLLFETQFTLYLPQWKPRTNKATEKITEKTYEANNSAKTTAHPFEQTGNIHLWLWVYYSTDVRLQAVGALQNSSILVICHYVLTFTEKAFDRLNFVTAKHKFRSVPSANLR